MINSMNMGQDSDFLRKLFLNMPMGYFRLRIVLSDEGRVTDYEYLEVNERFLQISGRTREGLIGKMHTEIGPIFIKKLDLQVLAKVAYEGYVHESRADQFRSNSRYYDTTIYSPQYGDVVALFADVTDAVISSNLLRKSEAELNKIYNNIPVGIELYDSNGTMIDVNDQDAVIIGVPDRSTLLGRKLFEHPSLPSYALELLREGKDVSFDVSIDGMKLNRSYYGVAQDDRQRYLTVKCTVLYGASGELENYLLIIIDNTDIYKTSARLHEFESAFNSVAEMAEIGFFRWNPLKKHYMSTDQWHRNMGYTDEDPQPANFDDYTQLVHPDDVKAILAYIKDALTGKVKSFTHEFRVKDSRGGWKWLRTSSKVSEWDPDNGQITIIGINYNINDIKLAEQELVQARDKAEASDRLKSAFLANMSHEIRTPLNSIVGFSTVLAHTDDPEEKKQYAAIIESNNQHLLSLISDILDLSEMDSQGAVKLNFSEMNVADQCRMLLESMRLKATAGVELEYTGGQEFDNVTIVTDVKRFTQVLSNLVSNALKFTSAGHVRVDFKIAGGMAEISVADTGIGMDPSRAETVFERFVKLNEFVPGTGLGLAICKSIVRKLGGSIGAWSEGEGKGSRFWFTIPLEPQVD